MLTSYSLFNDFGSSGFIIPWHGNLTSSGHPDRVSMMGQHRAHAETVICPLHYDMSAGGFKVSSGTYVRYIQRRVKHACYAFILFVYVYPFF